MSDRMQPGKLTLEAGTGTIGLADPHPEWEQYPARWRDLAAEERQRRAETLARYARERERPA